VMNPWLGMGLVLSVMGSAGGGIAAYQRARSPHPEVARKLCHVATGGIALGLPWLFDRRWPVALLATLSTAALLAVRFSPALKSGIGSVLHAVPRESVGELCFPAAIAALFVLARGNALAYSIPILVLTFADPAAALVGMRYGRLRYRVMGGEKSVEGSAAFCVVAIACIAIPLLLVPDMATADVLALSLPLALVLTLVEAVAWRGLDNLFVPLAGFVGLEALLAATGIAGSIPSGLAQW